MDNLAGQQIKGYELHERIAAGGFGAVYRASQSTIGREVAVKVILPSLANKPDFIRRFEAEAQLIARLEHPFIVPLHDYWRDPDGAYLVMRYLRGGSLLDAIHQNGAYSIEDTINLFTQVAQGLHVAHRNQVIHRDIKPGNILLDEDGNGYLADFGIAKDNTTTDNITDPDAFIGSPQYLAPEQARSESVTPQTDIYSLGVVLYEILSGEHPFPNLQRIEVIFKHLNEPLPEITTLDDSICDDINRVIQKATTKNPNHRYQDVLEMLQALREAAKLDITATPASIVELLTPREQEVMQLIIDGKSNREIADILVLAEGTVKQYINSIYRKLKVRSRVQAIARARDLNFLIQKPKTDTSISTGYLPEPENPYKGLRAFQAADAQDYFGREKLTEKILNRLQQDGDYYRFLALVGPSGSGKSSLAKAGLIPALWRGDLPESENWYIVDLLPGAHPIDELEVALFQIATDKGMNLREQLERDKRGLLRVADMILPDDGSELLLVIDQFEEVFTLLDNETERVHFLNLLQEAVTDKRSRIRVVVTLRADYYDRPLQYPDFGELMRTRVETVLPLSAEELERAINQPAQQVGVHFENGLVSKIVSDVHYQPGALPLLQYALTELFERRDGRKLSLESYQAIGGTGGALAKRADEIYLEGDDEVRELVRQLFLRLVTLGEGAEDTRRRVNRAELLEIARGQTDAIHHVPTNQPSVGTSNGVSENRAELMNEIIDLYADSRLLSLDNDPATRQPTVEVAHEAILREWERLRQWLNDSRDDIKQERQVAQAADAWQVNNQDSSYLLRGARLEQAEKWREETELSLTPLVNKFVQVSIGQRETENQAEAARLEREKAQEQRSQVLLRALIVIFALAAVISGGFGLFAFNQRNEAELARDSESMVRAEAEASLQRTNAQRLGLESTSLAQASGDHDLIALLAVASLTTEYTSQGDFAIQEALQLQYPEDVVVTGSPIGNTSVTISPDGTLLAIGGNNGVVTILSADTHHIINEMSADDAVIDSITFVGDNKRVAVGQWPAIHVFDIETGDVIFTRDVSEGRFGRSIDYVPEVNILAVGSNLANVLLLDANTWEEIAQLETPSGAFELGVSPDGRYLLTSESGGHLVRMWDMTTRTLVAAFNHAPQYVYEPQISPDGQHLAVVTGGGGLWVWDVDQPDTPLHSILNAHLDETSGLAFTPDGKTVITGSLDTLVKFWDVETGLPSAPDLPHPAQVTNLVVSQDGKQLFTVGTDPNLRVWATTFDNPIPHIPSQRHWYSQAFSPDGQKVANIRYKELRITDLVTGDVFLYEHDTVLNAVDYSPDGRYVFFSTLPSGGQIAEMLLMDVEEERIVQSFDWTGWLGLDVTFSKDGQWVAATGIDDIAIWDIETGERVFTEIPTTSLSSISVTLDISPDKRYLLVSFGWGEKAVLIDLETEEVIWEVALIPTQSGVAFSPDGQYFVIGDGSRIVRMWETETQTHVRDFVGHYRGITAVDFSPDGELLISGSEDGTARIWNVATGEEVRRFKAESVAHVLFSPDGEHILMDDGFTVTLWNTNISDNLTYLCEHITRDFTEEERMIYEIDTGEATCNFDAE